MYHVVSSNVETLKERGLENKNAEISVVVKSEDIIKGNKDPKFYAFRYGMVYDPENDFKPNIEGNHKIKGQLVMDYISQLNNAKSNYLEMLDCISVDSNNSNNNAEIEKLVSEYNNAIEQKNIRIKEQSEQIEQLKKNSNSTDMDEMKNLLETLKTIQSNRIEIKIGNKATKIIEKVVHEKLKDIIQLLQADERPFLVGPSGTGKSELAKQIADILEVDFYPMSTITQEFKLTGFIDGNGTYHETNFYKAVKNVNENENGTMLFFDEMDSYSEDVLIGINGLLANGYFDFPTETVTLKHKLYIIGAGNTVGLGADDEYTGRNQLDLSTLDRFLTVEIDYSPTIDKTVANNDIELVEFAHSLRKASKETEISILMSYRSIKTVAKLKDLNNFSLEDIIKMSIIKGRASDDIRLLADNMRIDSKNQYYKALKKVVA